MRAQLRIVAGALRGRKLTCDVHPGLRPTPDMVREALFSILGNAVPDRPFFDVFAGTGVIGLEALSRGASETTFVERDFRLNDAIHRHAKTFGVLDRTVFARADVYRWVERWAPPDQPVTVFVSPPFEDLERAADVFLGAVARLREKIAPGSVLVLQVEESAALTLLPDRDQWDERRYGRNRLLIWVKEGRETPTG
jgi:16S rRNA (guanine(966)-N(2))-methyltransferase RsmD